MHDFRKIVQERVASLRLAGAAEPNLIEELAQHIEDRYNELRSGGATEAEAYAKSISELDDIHLLDAGLEKSQHMPRRDAVPLGAGPKDNFIADLWRDLRYTCRTMGKIPCSSSLWF
jgi:hypothetical protein